MDSVPPFHETYRALFQNSPGRSTAINPEHEELFIAEECELPLIDLNCLNAGCWERKKCKREIARASSQWGFFQVVNHGVPQNVLDRILQEQRKVFRQPFRKKAQENVLNLSDGCYRWGNQAATSLRQLPWSEAFHITVADISSGMDEYKSLSFAVEVLARKVGSLAQILAEILAQNLGLKTSFFQENCSASTCNIRLTRYPPCPISCEVFGLIPHTDSDFLTILYQDQVGGLQLAKDGQWFSVKPNPEALIVNIGDLFQAWSNGVYKSVEHRVVANQEVERFSVAYFYCPSNNTRIQCCSKAPVYRKFTFEEYRQQVQRDVQNAGDKVGLSRFLL